MKYHQAVEDIKHLLTEHSCQFEAFEHEPVRTCEEAAKLHIGYTPEQGVKTIIARVKEPGKGKKFVMFVMPGNKKIDIHVMKSNTGFVDVRFAFEKEVDELTGGILPGGVPPFGNLFNLEVFADTTLFDNEKIIFNAGDRSCSISMLSSDFKNIVRPIITPICQ